MRVAAYLAAIAAAATMSQQGATNDPVRPSQARIPFTEQRGLPGPPKHRSQRQQRKAKRRG